MKEDEMGRVYGTYGEKRSAYKVFVGKPEGKGPLGRPKHRWEETKQICKTWCI
jgi:hypothetical protein